MTGRGVQVTAEQPVDNSNQDFFVLLTQEGVGERVGRSLAVRQALTDDPPVAVDVHEGQKLGQPGGGENQE